MHGEPPHRASPVGARRPRRRRPASIRPPGRRPPPTAGRPVVVDHLGRDLAIQRLARGEQSAGTPPRRRRAACTAWPPAGTRAHSTSGGAVEPDDVRQARERLPHGVAAARRRRRERARTAARAASATAAVDDVRLEGAEAGLSALGEDRRDRAGLRDDQVVGVDEGNAERRGQLASHGALARAHEADERHGGRRPWRSALGSALTPPRVTRSALRMRRR